MFKTHKIIPPGAISWDNSGNNKAYQSKQAAFVMNPTSIYAYLDGNDKDLQKVTGLFPVPAGPKGSVNQIDTWSLGPSRRARTPSSAKGLIEYFMQPANYDKIVQSTGGRWVPVYKRLFDSPFWKEKPVFKHFIQMAETGRPAQLRGLAHSGGRRGPEHPRHRQDDPARPRRELAGREGPRGSAQGRSRRSTPGTPRAKLARAAARARREREGSPEAPLSTVRRPFGSPSSGWPFPVPAG